MLPTFIYIRQLRFLKPGTNILCGEVCRTKSNILNVIYNKAVMVISMHTLH